MADPLAGITGSVNAGLKSNKRQPQFPKGLDQHFGLGPGITGAVHAGAPAPSPKPSFSLGGITGHALAPKATPATPKFSLRGVQGATNAGLKGPPPLPISSRGPTSSALQRFRANQVLAGREAQQYTARTGERGTALPVRAHALSSKELAKYQTRQLQTSGLGKNLIASAEPKEFGKFSLSKMLENTPRSAQSTIVNTIPGLVKTGEAGVEAIKGHPGNLEKIGKGLGQMISHPAQALEKEPVPTALMALGAVGGAGRAAGALGRAGVAGEAGVRAASLDRPAMMIYGRPRFIVDNAGVAKDQIDSGFHDTSPLMKPRQYSPDLIHKGVQVAAEKLREARGRNPNVATGEEANRYIYGGGLFGQHIMKPLQGMIKPGLVDIEAAKGERMRRMYGKAAAEYLNQIKPKHGADAVPLMVEGTVRTPKTLEADLQKELDRLKESHANLEGKAEKKLNEKNQKQIETLQGDRHFLANPHEAFAAAKDYADWSRPYEHRMVELGILEPDQLNARNVPFALAHGYADRYNLSPGDHELVGQIAAVEREIREKREEITGKRAVQRHVKTEQAVSRQPYQLAKKGGVSTNTLRAEKARMTREGFTSEEKFQLGRAGGRVRRAREDLLDLREKKQQLEWDLQHAKDSGAVRESGAQWPRLEKEGKPVSHAMLNERVKEQLGDRRLGFITHKETSYGQAQHARLGYAPAAERNLRTGESFQKGIYRRDYNALRLQAYKNMNKIVGQESRNNVLRRFGIGAFHDEKKADEAKTKFEETKEGERLKGPPGKGLGDLKVVSLGNKKVIDRGAVRPRDLGPMLNDFLPSSDRAIAEAADKPTHTLIHERTLERINEHDWLNSNKAVARAMQWYTNKWRSAALYTSPRWMVGNPQEHAIRLAFAGVNPFAIFGSHLAKTSRAIAVGNALLDHWANIASDESRTAEVRFAARAMMADWQGGTHYGSLMMNEVRREARDFTGRDLKDAFAETTPISKTISLWGKYKQFIGNRMMHVEQRTKAGMLGKAALKEQGTFTKEWRDVINLQDRAIKDYAEQKLGPNQSAELGERIMDMAGNWSTLTPAVRKAVQSWSPFGLWWLNSVKFVFKTLPKDHPMKTAALAAMIAGTGANETKGEIAKFLEGGVKLSLPYLGDVTLQQTYYSPMGIAIEPGNTAAGMAFPQLDEASMLARGLEPLSHNKIQGIQAPEQIAQIGSNLAIGAIPFGRQAQQIARSGGKPEYASMNPVATKPGTQRPLPKVLLKMVAPGRLTLPSRSEEKAGKGSLQKEVLGKEALQKENLPKEKLLKY